VNGISSSAYTNTVTVNIPVPPPPSAPTNLTAALQAGPQILLTWLDNATNETGFVVERSDNGGAFVQIAAPGLRTNTGSVTYTDTAVAVGNTYQYRVNAVNAAGPSAYSGVVTVSITTAPALPAAPSNLTATATRGFFGATVNLTWSDNSTDETGFTIQRATDAAFTNGLNTTTVAANTTTRQQTFLPRGVTYYYRVRATNSVGPSEWSNVVQVTTP